MPKVITRTVNVRNPDTLIVSTFSIGDELPEWAEPLVTNPKVYAHVDPEAVRAAVSAATATDDSTPPPSPENAPTAAQDGDAADSGAETPAGDEDNPVTRPELEKRAKELKIRFTTETTDAELDALIASKE